MSDKISCSFRICRNVQILYSFFRINECIQFSLPQFLGRWLISNCLPFGKLPSQLQFFATMRIDKIESRTRKWKYLLFFYPFFNLDQLPSVKENVWFFLFCQGFIKEKNKLKNVYNFWKPLPSFLVR